MAAVSFAGLVYVRALTAFRPVRTKGASIKILPTAITVAKWTAVLGLACGVLYSVGGFFVDLFTIGLNFGTVLAFGALIGMPVIFGAFGFVCGALAALTAQGFRAAFHR